MAQSTAYYEGLQYGENKIPDFGGAAIKGVDRMIQLQNDERKRQEKELQFRMKMIQDNPEVVYASFENSGIKNVDTYNAKVADLVKNKFEQINMKFQEDGDKEKYFMGVAKLKGEVANYNAHIKPMIEYGQKITELGENASAVMYDNVERIDAAMQFGVPSMSPDGTLSNVSVVPQDDGSYKKDQIAFGEMQSLTSVHQRQDKFGLAANAVKSFGEDSRFVDDKGRVVLSTLLTKDGKLQGSAERIIRADVSALGRSSLVDIADQFGVRAQYGSNGELLNRKELVDAIAEEEVKYATSLIQEKQTEDEFAYENLDLKTKALALRYSQEARAKKGTIRANQFHYTPQMAAKYGNVFGTEGGGFTEHIMRQDKDKLLRSVPGFGIELSTPGATESIQNGMVQALWEDPNGQHAMIITVPSEMPEVFDDPAFQGRAAKKIKWKDTANTYYIPLVDPTQVNILRSHFDIGEMSEQQKEYYSVQPTTQPSSKGVLD